SKCAARHNARRVDRAQPAAEMRTVESCSLATGVGFSAAIGGDFFFSIVFVGFAAAFFFGLLFFAPASSSFNLPRSFFSFFLSSLILALSLLAMSVLALLTHVPRPVGNRRGRDELYWRNRRLANAIRGSAVRIVIA